MNSSNPKDPRSNSNNRLVPPGGKPDRHNKGRLKTVLMLLGLFAVLMAGALAVLRLQPTQVAEISPNSTPAAAPPLSVDQPPAGEPVAMPQKAAEEAREQLWSLKVEAETQQVDKWGGAEYEEVAARLATADEQFRTGKFGEAAHHYVLIEKDLQVLLDSRNQRLGEALLLGYQTLSDEQPEEAQKYFTTALTIEPTSEEARTGLRQAQQRAELLAIYRSALSLEETGRLEEAATRLELIIGFEPPYEPARQAYQRIRTQLKESAFGQEMDSLLTALRARDFASARRSLEKLQQLGVHQQEVDQAAALVAEQAHRASIEVQRTKAESLTGAERWQEALEVYETILQEEPGALFAEVGREEASRRAQLHTSLSDAITRASRLQDEQQRSAVDQLLDYAGSIDPQGPKLKSQIADLTALLERSRTPVSVLFESDNLTEVAIYHIGRIGSFVSKKITLKPGTYTVVGSREGYRDVRKIITIEPDGHDHRFDIRCGEPI